MRSVTRFPAWGRCVSGYGPLNLVPNVRWRHRLLAGRPAAGRPGRRAIATAEPRALLAAVLCAGLLLFPSVGAASKQAMAPIAIVLAAAMLTATLWADRRAALRSRPVAALFALFLAYVGLFHLPPALGDGGSGETVAKLAVLALILWLAAAGWPSVLAPPHLRLVALWGLAGLALGSAFLLVELLLDSPFHRLADGLDSLAFVDAARHNRPAVALMLVSLPLAGLLARQAGRLPALAALVLGIVPALIADSAAGWLAVATAAVVHVAARWRPRWALAAGCVVTAGFIVAAPLLLPAMYRASVERGVELPLSFTDRLEIWDHAASAVAASPWTGTGLGSVKHLPMTGEQLARYRFHKAPSPHGHDAAIQIWVEFGAVGIAAGLALLGIGARAIGRMDGGAQAVALPATAALLVIAMLSFGVWQETWLGMIGVSIVLIRLAALPERTA